MSHITNDGRDPHSMFQLDNQVGIPTSFIGPQGNLTDLANVKYNAGSGPNGEFIESATISSTYIDAELVNAKISFGTPYMGILYSNETGIATVANGISVSTDGNSLTITENLTVHGDFNVVGANNVIISDPILELGNQATMEQNTGVIFSRPMDAGNVGLIYITDQFSEYDNTLVIGYHEGWAGSDDIRPNVEANITVEVLGNLVAANYYGNAANMISLTGMAEGTYGNANVSNGSANIMVMNVDANGYISNVSNLVIQTSGNIQQTTDIGNITTNTVIFANTENSFVTYGTVGIMNVDSHHTLALGNETHTGNLYISGNVSIDTDGSVIRIGAGAATAVDTELTTPLAGMISLGTRAGREYQNSNAIAIGLDAGFQSQNSNAVSIGTEAGQYFQGLDAISVGVEAGRYSQNARSLAIGTQSGLAQQGADAVAMGYRAGKHQQEAEAFAVGVRAGESNQGSRAMALGVRAGSTNQGEGAVAIGFSAGRSAQSANAVAIGFGAGNVAQGANSVAIGYQAATTSQHANTVVINATGQPLETQTTDAIYLAPVRFNPVQVSRLLTSNADTGELVQANVMVSNANVGVNLTDVLDITEALSVGGNVKADYFVGNANTLVSTTDVADGSYGDLNNVVAVTILDGRISALTNVASNIHDLQNVSEQGNTYDSSVILTHAELGLRASGNVEALQFIGNAAHLVSTTNVADDTYGGVGNIAAITITDGRITAMTNVVATTVSTLQDVVESGNSSSNTIQLGGNSMALAAQGNVSVGSLVDNHTNLHVTGNVIVTNAVSATNLVASGNVTAEHLFFGDGGVLTNVHSSDSLQNVANTGNIFTGNIQFITSPVAFTTTGNVGIANAEPIPRAFVSLGDDDTTQKKMIHMSGNCVIDCLGPSVAIGMEPQVQGSASFALGQAAGGAGCHSISIGAQAGRNSRNDAVAIGGYAGNNTQGGGAVAVGHNAGRNNQGDVSIAIGHMAGNGEQELNAVAIGSSAARGFQGSNTVAVGAQAGRCQQNTQSVAVGYAAGKSNQNSRAVAIGNQAGEFAQNVASVAIGYMAGQSTQNASAIAIGYEAGRCQQNTYAVSVGRQAGESHQNAYAISIGYLAGQEFQNAGSISVGYQAGRSGQGSYAIAMGRLAGRDSQPDNSIILNASGVILNATKANAFHVSNVLHEDTETGFVTAYNSTTKEVFESNIYFENGYVGINNTAPEHRLAVGGNVWVRSNVYSTNVNVTQRVTISEFHLSNVDNGILAIHDGAGVEYINVVADVQNVSVSSNLLVGNTAKATNLVAIGTTSDFIWAGRELVVGNTEPQGANLQVWGNVHTTGNIKTVANVIASDLYGDGTNIVYSGLTTSSQFTFPNAQGKLSSVSNVAWNTSGQSGYPSQFLDISGNVVFSNGNVEMTTSDLHVVDVYQRDAIHEDGRIHFTHPGQSNDPQFVIESVDVDVLSTNAISSVDSSNVKSSVVDNFGNVLFHQNVEVSGNTHSNLVTDMIVFDNQSTPAVSGLGIDLNNVVIRGNTATNVVTIDNAWSMQTTGYVNVNSAISRTQVVVGTDTLGSESNLCVSGNAFMGANLTVDGCIHVMRDDYGNYSGGDIRIYQGNTAPLYYYSICNEGQDLSVKASSGTNSITGDTDTVRMRTDTAGASIRVGGSSTSNTVVHNGGSVYRVFSGPAGGGIHFTLNAVYPSDYDGGTPNGTINLGGTTNQWQNFYYSGSLVSSDRNLKQDEEDFTAAEARVAVRIKNLMKKFRYRDRVAIRGDDARLHSGVIAQDVESAFQEEGLDAHRYSLWSETAVYHDNATDTIIERYYYNVDTGEHVVNEDPPYGIAGEWTHIEHPLNYPEVSRTFAYHVNYPELLCFIIANI